MDVTVDNFDEALDLFRDVLSRAHFAAFDLEFTGLRTNNMLQRSSVEPVRRGPCFAAAGVACAMSRVVACNGVV